MQTVSYAPDRKALWDATVEASRNGTFLMKRDYMDYHKDRFADCSLLFLTDSGKCLACLPSNFNATERRVETHGGLTYGGLVCTPEVTTAMALDMLRSARETYRRMGAATFIYKPVPHIYHTYPCEEELYALFRAGAVLSARAVSTAVDLTCPRPLSALRKRKAAKALRAGLTVDDCRLCDAEAALADFWAILTDVLAQRHHTSPVHTLREISLLRSRFEKEIRLYVVRSPQGTVLGGCVAYMTRAVAHIQYIAAGSEGRACGALDLLFSTLIGGCFTRQRYLDFGISTEQGGSVLNEGLIFQKEGFGGRAVCYDTYTINL